MALARVRKSRILWIAVVALILGGVVLARPVVRGPGAGTAPPLSAPAVPVVTALARQEDVPIYLSGIGTVTPLQSVTVKVRVDGQLESVSFREGQDVRSGELLAQIDPRPYRAQLEQAQAQKVRDEAQLRNGFRDLARDENLVQRNFISGQMLDTQRTTVEQLKAVLQADQAQIDTAQIQLDYTTIRAPLAGRTGVRLVDPGNIVHATDSTGIVIINQIDPIAVLLTLPEEKFQLVNQAIRDSAEPLEAQALAREDGALLARGKLTLVNNQIDTATGTFQVKAVFANASHQLWPGQYVSVRLVLGTRSQAVTVPSSVVQRGPNGLFAYVVASDGAVSPQPLRTSQTQDDKAIIDEGLAVGTRVVVEGQYKLKPGVKVVEVDAAASAKAPAPAQPSPAANTQPNAR